MKNAQIIIKKIFQCSKGSLYKDCDLNKIQTKVIISMNKAEYAAPCNPSNEMHIKPNIILGGTNIILIKDKAAVFLWYKIPKDKYVIEPFITVVIISICAMGAADQNSGGVINFKIFCICLLYTSDAADE